MKSLIKNYIDLLSVDKLKEFSIKNNINLTNTELEYLLNLVKTNYENILSDDTKYIEDVKKNVDEHQKVIDLYLYYKNKYKGYLF